MRQEIDAVLDYLAASGRQLLIHYLWRPMLRDPSDDLVLEVAVAGQCNTIVPYNIRDIAGSERFGVRPMTPVQFLARTEKRV